MRTRRSVLVGVGGLIAIAGCSQQSGQPTEEGPDTEGASGEFGIDQFRVGGENPDEYEAEFIAGSNASEVADELTPEVSYQIAGASGEVETEVRYEYSDATIPEDGPLDETVEGDTHDGNGEYAQAISMPDELVSEILQKPKNLVVTFRATDTQSEGQASREYELNFADSYMEQIQKEMFNQERFEISDAELVNNDVSNSVINLEYNSDHEIGSVDFDLEISGFAGLYSANIGITRIPYEANLTVNDTNGDTYKRNLSNDPANQYLDGEISEREMKSEILHNRLTTNN